MKKEEWRIDDLIEQLYVDEDIYDIDDVSPSLLPRKAIDELIALNTQALPKLIEALKDYYEKDSVGLHGQLIVDILGEIRDPSVVPELLKVLQNDFDDAMLTHVSRAIQKIGTSAVPTLSQVLKSNKSDISLLLFILEILRETPSEESLRIAGEMLEHKDDDVKSAAIEILERQGSARHTTLLERFLDEEKKFLFEDAKKALRSIYRENPEAFRDVLQKHNVIGLERMKKLGWNISHVAQNMGYEYSYGTRFVGDTADELNKVLREFHLRKEIMKALYEMMEIGSDEAVLSFPHYTRLKGVYSELEHIQEGILRKYGDAIVLSDHEFEYYHEPVMKVETKTIKKKYESVVRANSELKKWLNGKGFKVNNQSSTILAKDEHNRTCIIYFNRTEGKRVYSDIKLRLHGKGWSERKILPFIDEFWKVVDSILKYLP